MHNHRTFHFGVQFSVLLKQRVGNDVARHRSQPRGLVDNRQPWVVVDNGYAKVGDLLMRVRVNVEPLHHKGEYRQAFAATSRIERAVVSNLGSRRFPPPKLSHASRREVVSEGVLQQARSGTFAGAGRGHALCCWLEDVQEVAAFATGITHHKQLKQTPLQMIGARAAQLFHLGNLLLGIGNFGSHGQRGYGLCGGSASTL